MHLYNKAQKTLESLCMCKLTYCLHAIALLAFRRSNHAQEL